MAKIFKLYLLIFWVITLLPIMGQSMDESTWRRLPMEEKGKALLNMKVKEQKKYWFGLRHIERAHIATLIAGKFMRQAARSYIQHPVYGGNYQHIYEEALDFLLVLASTDLKYEIHQVALKGKCIKEKIVDGRKVGGHSASVSIRNADPNDYRTPIVGATVNICSNTESHDIYMFLNVMLHELAHASGIDFHHDLKNHGDSTATPHGHRECGAVFFSYLAMTMGGIENQLKTRSYPALCPTITANFENLFGNRGFIDSTAFQMSPVGY